MNGPDSITNNEDQRAVQKTIGRFGRAFAALDVPALCELWDTEYPYPVYQPEETAEPMLTAGAVREYFENLPNVIRGAGDIRPIDFRIDVMGDIAHAFARSWVRLAFVHIPDPLEGEVRQSFILRKRSGQWRLIHYHESRITAGLTTL